MCWADGPLIYNGMTATPTDAVLCLQSGSIGIALDTKTLKFRHAGRFSQTIDCESAMRCGSELINGLPSLALELSVQNATETFTCTGRGPLSNNTYFFPIRFVDSGHFFQRISIEDLEFISAKGVKLNVKGRMEVAMWPDRLTLSADLTSASTGALSGNFNLRAGEERASVSLQTSQSVSLTLFHSKQSPRAKLTVSDPGVRCEWDDRMECHVVHTPDKEWKNSQGTDFPSDELDRLDKWKFELANDTDFEIVEPVMFVPDRFPTPTGASALLCDPDGTPTGIPVQLSKNWHVNPKLAELQHWGVWFHGCTLIHLPAHSRREFLFEMAYARYGGIPAASHAQLSLIGWAGNQFWDEAAIGSFGETVCFEPGRMQRRCFIDDLRPLMLLTPPKKKPNGWTGNVGGGDYLMWINGAGTYQGFRATRTNYRAYGPCLTNVEYSEQTAGGEMTARMSVSLERSDDFVRVFQHLHYEVKKPMTWERLAFFQLGSDHYNSIPVRWIAVGDSDGMREEWAPPVGSNVYQHRSIPLCGTVPWISLHGTAASSIPSGAGHASRGLIVRSWNSVLGGRRCSTPHMSVYATEVDRGNFRTTVELSPPPQVTQLRPGDFVDADVELVVFPSDANTYYGPNESFREASQRDGNSWTLTQREASKNALVVKTSAGRVQRCLPLSICADESQRVDASLNGGLGFVPLSLTGLHSHRDFELRIDGQPLHQAIHGNDFWQTDFDPSKQEWTITYNIPQPVGEVRLEFGPGK